MFLRLYQSNQPFVLLFLPLIGMVFWLPSFINPLPLIVTEGRGPLFDILAQFVSFSPFLSTLIAYFLVLAIVLLTNKIYNDQQFTDRQNYLPALSLLVLMSASEDLCRLHPVQPCLLFILLALKRIFSMYRQLFVGSAAFDTGFLFSIAVLFYPPAWAVLPFIWVSLVVLRAFNWREWIIPILGILTPVFLTLSIGFIFEKNFQWEKQLVYKNAIVPATADIFGGVYLVSTLLAITLAGSGFLKFIRSLSSTTMHKRNIKQVFLILALFLLVAFVNAAFLDQRPNQICLLLIPLAIWMSIYLQEAKKQWLAKSLYYAWLIFSIWLYYI